jgi:hypothetical protein
VDKGTHSEIKLILEEQGGGQLPEGHEEDGAHRSNEKQSQAEAVLGSQGNQAEQSG